MAKSHGMKSGLLDAKVDMFKISKMMKLWILKFDDTNGNHVLKLTFIWMLSMATLFSHVKRAKSKLSLAFWKKLLYTTHLYFLCIDFVVEQMDKLYTIVSSKNELFFSSSHLISTTFLSKWLFNAYHFKQFCLKW